jgi:glucokinase
MRALGFDLGGSKLLGCLTDGAGAVLARAVRATGRATGPADACRLLSEVAAELRASVGPFDVVGIGFPGQVDFDQGIAHASVMLDGWREVPLAEQVAAQLAVPCVVDNDVNAAAVAELRLREAEAPDSMLFVAVGTGIGGALAIHGRLWRGHTGVAGEIGNMTIDRHGPSCWCGRRGCLNVYASGAAIEAQLGAGVSLAEHTRAGHPALGEVVRVAAELLGVGLANALNLLNPELVVLGGGVSELGGPWLARVAAAARQEAFPEAGQCRFELARAGYEAGAVGAALLAMERYAPTTTGARPAHAGAAAPGGPRLSAAPRAAP